MLTSAAKNRVLNELTLIIAADSLKPVELSQVSLITLQQRANSNNCSIGYSCGYGCISKEKGCTSPLSPPLAAYARYAANIAQYAKGQSDQAKRLLGQAQFDSDEDPNDALEFKSPKPPKTKIKPAAKNCKKGYSCGYSCISKTYSCRKVLEGQAKTYADYAQSQALKASPQTSEPTAATKTLPKASKAPKKLKQPKTELIPIAPDDGFPKSPGDLKQIKVLGGSTGALLMEDADGNKFVLKKGASPEHIREEFIADEAYRALGVKVPDSKLYETATGPVKLSRFIDGKTLAQLSGDKVNPALSKLKQNFVVDALLGNWDVTGVALDNVLVDASGEVWRIDNGGALRFRAQGAPKGEAWNEHPAELWTMADYANNPSAAMAFNLIAKRDIFQQMGELKAKSAPLLASLPPELRGTIAQKIDTIDKLSKYKAIPAGSEDFTFNNVSDYAKMVVKDMQAGKLSAVPSLTAATASMKRAQAKAVKAAETGLPGDTTESAFTDAQFEPILKAAFAAVPKGGNIKPNQSLSDAEREAAVARIEQSTLIGSYADGRDHFIGKFNSPSWKAPPPPPQAEELGAIRAYTSIVYRRANESLRHDPKFAGARTTQDLSTTAKTVKLMKDYNALSQLAAAGMAELPSYTGTSWRGADLDDALLSRYVAGQEVTEFGFTSSSRFKGKAFFGNTQFEIKSKTGKNVERFSTIPEEEEVLYAPNTKFKVKEVRTELGSTYIKLEEI